MTQSPDHPELQFIEARTSTGGPMYTIGRPDGIPLWVVIHDMEKVESPDCAEWTANYFATGAGGRSVSSHYTADDNSIIQCVLLRNSAWTVGNRPGNNRGINWELCGFAAQTREQWLDPFGVAMFNRMVPIIRSDAAKYGIPLVKRTVAELKAWVPGITSHNDLREAFNVTDHTDPGSNFPWDYFMALLTGDDMDAETKQWIKDLHFLFFTLDSAPRPPDSEAGKIETIRQAVTSGTGGGGLTAAQVRAIVREELDRTKLGT